MSRDYYEILGVAKNASADELKRSYRQLARKLHPDANQDDPEAEEHFKEVTLAYEVLSNPESRRRYDMFGPEAIRGSGAAGNGPNAGETIFGPGGLGDVFEAFFGNSPFGGSFGTSSSRRNGPQRGSDAEARLRLEFEQAVFGCTKELVVKIPVVCPTCSGSGAKPGTSVQTCSACGGAGEIRRVRQSILGQMVTSAPCGQCSGLGETVADPCSACRGDGRVTQERTYSVEIPAGVDDGATLRLSDRGPAGFRGGPNGDLYVHLIVAPSSLFTRDGYDLVHLLKISMAQAAIGGTIEVESLDGAESLVLPQGTQSGKVFRVKGKGVPHVGSRGRGDLVVSVQVETPTRLTKEQEDLLRAFAKSRGEEIGDPEEGIRSKIRSAFR